MPRGAHPFEPVIVLHAVHLKLFPPKVVVIRKHLLTPRVHAIVQRPQIEHIIKHIVTCQNHAARGYGAHSPRLTQARIIVKKACDYTLRGGKAAGHRPLHLIKSSCRCHCRRTES